MRLFVLLCGLVAFSASALHAQEGNTPPLPAPLQALVDEGAQIKYLGKEHGLDGWITIRNGQEQYFYVTADQKAMIMGLLFNADGKLLTVQQVQKIQQKSGDILEMFAAESPAQASSESPDTSYEFKTPAEKLFEDVENSNWVPMGIPDAPVIYSFIDPQCSHCHAFLDDLRYSYIDSGLLQLRMIPVGFREETQSQAAVLLAAPEPQKAWFRHMDGDESALPPIEGASLNGVVRNVSVMQSWNLNATPITVYRSASGKVKIVQGRPKSVRDILKDLEG